MIWGKSCWWLRSPSSSNGNNERNINPSGTMNNNNSNNTNGVAPDCVVSKHKVTFWRNQSPHDKELLSQPIMAKRSADAIYFI